MTAWSAIRRFWSAICWRCLPTASSWSSTGLVSFWFVRQYEQSRAFHWAMTIFWAFIALAHFGVTHRLPGPIINSVPFVLFAVVGLIRWKTEKTEIS